MIDLGFLLIRNVQKDVLIIQKYCHHLLPQAGLWQWTFFLKNFWSVFQSPVNVVFWCFPSLARMMELHWSKDSSEASQNLPGAVKRLQTSSSSSSLSLACSHAATGQVPDAQHRTPILMVSECALHLAEAVTRKPFSPRLRGQALAGGEPSMRCRECRPSWEFRAPSPSSPWSQTSLHSWVWAKHVFLTPCHPCGQGWHCGRSVLSSQRVLELSRAGLAPGPQSTPQTNTSLLCHWTDMLCAQGSW